MLDTNILNFDKWHKRLIKELLIILIINTIFETIFFICNIKEFSFNIVILFLIESSILGNVTILSLTAFATKFIGENLYDNENFMYNLIILSTTLFFTNIVIHNYNMYIIYSLFLLPIILSTIYGNRRITTITSILNLSIFILLHIVYLPNKYGKSLFDNSQELIFMVFSIFMCYIFCITCIDREKEMIQTITLALKTEEEMCYQLKRDPFTGLYNHKTFYEMLELLVEEKKKIGFSLCLSVIDIDNFKKVNDTYGHVMGDKVIEKLSNIILQNVDTRDIASRYGGEEFAIIFYSKKIEKSYSIVEKIRYEFNNSIIEGVEKERFSISIGVCAFDDTVNNFQNFFDRADSALYEAKQTGKNKTIISKIE